MASRSRNQEARRQRPVLQAPAELAGLLRDPGGGRVARAAREVDPPGPVLDEEQDVHGLQEEGLHGEEVARQELIPVAAQEAAPGAARPPTSGGGGHAPSLEDVPDGGTSDGEAQLGELAVDATVAPARVLARQAHDQRLELGRDGRSARGAPAREGPLAADEVAVPPQHRLGADHQHAPTQPDLPPGHRARQLRRQDGQGKLLPAREPWGSGLPPLQEAELVAQQDDLQVLLVR